MLSTRYSVLSTPCSEYSLHGTGCKSIEVSDRTHTHTHTHNVQSSCGCLAGVNLGLVWGLGSGLGTGTVGHALKHPRNQISKSVLHTLWRLCQGLLTLVLDTTQLNSTQLDSGTNGCAWPGKRQSQRQVNAMTAEARRGQTLLLPVPLLIPLPLYSSHSKMCCSYKR